MAEKIRQMENIKLEWRLVSSIFGTYCLVTCKLTLEELFENFNLKILEFAETYSDYWIIGKSELQGVKNETLMYICYI